MRFVVRPGIPIATWWAVAVLGSCSGSGSAAPLGGAGGGGGEASSRELQVVRAEPGDGGVQVALSAELRVTFDGAVALESLDVPATGLFEPGRDERIPATFATDGDGTTVVFRPQQALRAESDYELRLDPLTSDQDGRVLDREVRLGFRTIDSSPPTVVAWSYQSEVRPLGPDSPLELVFDEALDPASVGPETVTLRDTRGATIPADLTLTGRTVRCAPWRDLGGPVEFVIAVRGVADRSGNRALQSWSARGTTPKDRTPPEVLAVWPPPSVVAVVSPRAAPRITLSESIEEPASGPGAPFIWKLDDGTLVPFDPVTSRDGRVLHLVPRAAVARGRRSLIETDHSKDPIVDRSGNRLSTHLQFEFLAGDDARPPQLARSTPAAAADRIPPYVEPSLEFDEPLDAASVGPHTIALEGPDGARIALDGVTLDASRAIVRLRPASALAAGVEHRIRVRGGLDGVRDPAGNASTEDLVIRFSTNPVSEAPTLSARPSADSIGVALDATLVVMSSIPLTADSVAALAVFDDAGAPVPGATRLEAGARAVRFVPDQPWSPGAHYTSIARGGPRGMRAENGNWLRDDVVSGFRTGYRSDESPPRVSISLDGIRGERTLDRCVPRHGFAIEVRAADGIDPTFDPASVELIVESGGVAIAAASIAAAAQLADGRFTYHVPASEPLPLGTVTVRATGRDLSGNRATAVTLAFVVADPDDRVVPFERTQVVWVRFDLDRDGNGREDFLDDLERLGLTAVGDPLGANTRLASIIRAGVLARVRALFGRAPSGAPTGPDSVALRVTDRAPHGVPHMQIACGGFDPEGRPGRGPGEPSTGALGRAWFDFRNEDSNEQNISVSPGLGVFPSELFLFEVRAHQQLYPAFVTAFASRFLPLTPTLGGAPAGAHALDPVALDPTFDPVGGPSAAIARWRAVFGAADDWATVVGTILAHEIGHTVGLTAPGTGRDGLHGDASLHNIGSNTTDVMAAAIGFDALVSLDFRFRDLNVAYLRHRVLLR